MKPIILSLIAVLLSAESVSANPILFSPGFSPPEFLGLLLETAVVTWLLRRHGFRPKRLFVAWFAVTLVTYWLGLAGFMATTLISDAVTWLVLTFLLLETAIVVTEARAVMWIAGKPSVRSAEGEIHHQDALKVSLAGNVTSLVVAAAVYGIILAL